MEKKKNSWQLGVLAFCLLMTLASEIWKIQVEVKLRQEEKIVKEEYHPAVESEEKKQEAQPVSEEKPDLAEENIRVLLMTSGYTSYYHQQVTAVLDGKTVAYSRENLPLTGEGAPVVLNASDGEGICIQSIERTQGNPVYQGKIEIYHTQEGFLLVNEVPLETYLCAVVPSEMPSDYETEALKAQAVCARTYAVRQMQDQRLQEYHAMVDDSVEYQVYQNIAPQPATTQAVKETAGEILCQNGEPIQAYYFSTSAGMTSTDEVWEAQEEASYLKSVVCDYDAKEPWSSWQADLPVELINEKIKQTFGEGKLESAEAVKRSQGGALTQINLYTDAGNYEIHREYDIREFFSVSGHTITLQEGETQGGNLLPSAYFTFEPYYQQGVLAGYHLEGKGYGHGVGMSQTGANHMAKEGKNYEDILNYFFLNVQLTSM